ncbi:plasmid recombination protein, partial [Pseudomonas aeruginosa]
MAAYAIMRCKKLATMGSVAAALQHCYRERETPNADAERTPDNEHRAATSTDAAMGRLRELLPEKRRKDAVLAVEYVMTASPEWWAKATPQQQAAFFDQAQGWLAAKYGADRIVTASIHRDEATPHLSAFVVPLTQDGRLSAKEFIGGRDKMRADQTSFAEAVRDLGLERGIEGSRATHQRV